MLPYINRLTKKKDFDEVFNQGKSVKSDFLLCKAIKSHLPKSRFGFVVSKKISNKATVRNLVKRRLRKSTEDLLSKVSGSFDVIVIALSGIEKKDFLEIEQKLGAAFKKLSLTN